MSSWPVFEMKTSDYELRNLQPEDAEALQRLFDQCSDYSLIVEGEPAASTAAQELFQETPPGRSLADKFVFGLVNHRGEVVGVLEGMRHYPEEHIWWIGLLLLAPAVRQQGLGRMIVDGFSEYVRSQDGVAMMLGVVADNYLAYKFWRQQGFEKVRITEPRQFGRKRQTVAVLRRSVDSSSNR
jgi:ribosomal protein S18 acetylase RimI-like enzyme